MRMRNKPWAIPELKENPLAFFDPEENKGKWNQVFGNENPIHLEIGAGYGKFSLEMARRHPDINFIALEMDTNVLVYAGRDYLEESLPNLKIVRCLAQHLLKFFDQDEISQIYLNFSNPWPANRHKKRRLTHNVFLDIYQVILKNEGLLIQKTDSKVFYDQSLIYFRDSKFEILETNTDLPESATGNIVTEYEAKWRSQGIKINYIKAMLKK